MDDDIPNAKADNQAAEARRQEAMYGNPGGSPGERGNIETPLNAVFDPLKEKARGYGKQNVVSEIDQARAGLVTSMETLGFSEGSAQELSGLMAEYRDRPRDDAQMGKNLDEALDILEDEWGDNFSAMFAGAEEVLSTLMKGNPSLTGFMHSTGLSRDVRLLRLAGSIAKSRGLVKK